jgi:hypothetical protein
MIGAPLVEAVLSSPAHRAMLAPGAWHTSGDGSGVWQRWCRYSIAVLFFIIASSDRAASIEYPLSNPFGISKSDIPRLIAKKSLVTDNSYTVVAPKPHPLLSKYSIRLTPSGVLCEVTGYAPYGSKTPAKTAEFEIESELTELLGKPIRHMTPPPSRPEEVVGVTLWGIKNEPTKNDGLTPEEFLTGILTRADRPHLVSLHRYSTGSRGALILRFNYSSAACDEIKPKPPNRFQ